MPALVLSQPEVRRLLPMETCIDLVEEALTALARGEGLNPLRRGLRLPDDLGVLGLMPGYLANPPTIGVKAVTVFPANHASRYDPHQGVVVLFDPEHGFPRAVVDASEVTAIRTAAVTALATRNLARPDAASLALLGTGIQARRHLEAIALVRPLERIRVFSPTVEHRTAFAEETREQFGLPVEAVSDAETAVRGADIVCTATSARHPIVRGEWIDAGCHINAVGSSVRHTRELDTATVAKARVFVDSLESATHEAGDWIYAQKEAGLPDRHLLAELGSVLLGDHPGREGAEEITLFKSLGLAIEDLAAARYVYARARREGMGTMVDLGGLRDGTA